jgi:hypothetical protein
MAITKSNFANRVTGLNPLAYIGVESYTPPSIFQMDRDPRPSDSKGYRIGDIWFSGSGLATEVWFLVGLDNISPIGKAFWTQIGMGGGGLTFHTSTGTDATPNAGIVNVYGGSNITTNAIIGVPQNTITIDLNPHVVIPGSLTVSSLGRGVVQTNNAGVFFSDNGASGQVIIGGGVKPTWAYITSVDGSITIDNTIPNGIGLSVTAGAGFSGLIDSLGNTAAPLANKVTVNGDLTFIRTNGITVANTLSVQFFGGTDGQIPIATSVVGGLPIWASITPDTGISVTPGNNSITIKNTLPFNALDTDVDGPAVPTAGKISITGDGVFTQTQAMGVPLDIIEVQFVCPGAAKGLVPITNAITGIPEWALITGSGGIIITENNGALDIAGGGGGGGGLVGIRTDDTNIAILDVGNRINVYGDGIIASSSAASTVRLKLEGSSDGELLVGNTATGYPIWATPTTTDGSITITGGANTIDFKTTGPWFEGLLSEVPDTAVPDAVAHKIAMTGDTEFLFTNATTANTLQTKFLGGLDGEIPIGKTGGVPLWKTLTEGANITITNAANSITIAAAGAGGGGLVALDGDIGTANLDGASKIKLHGLDLITTDAGTTASQVNIGLTRPGVAGQIPISHAAGAPLWASLTAGSHITITPANNAITIAAESGFDGLISDGPDDADALNNRVTVAGDLAFITTDAAVANTLTVNFTCPAATSGQIPIANAVTGIPVWGSILHADNSITVTEGAGTLDLSVTDAFKGLIDSATSATVDQNAVSKRIKVLGDEVLTRTLKTAADELTVQLTGGVSGQIIGGVSASDPAWLTLTSVDASVVIDAITTPGTINFKSVGGGGGAGATLFITPSGNGIVYAGQFKINDGINTNAKIYSIAQPSDTLIIDLNAVIYWLNTNAGGTTGMIYLGGSKFMHNLGGTFLGAEAGNLASLGYWNVGIGTGALRVNSCVGSTAIGYNSQDACTSGNYNTSTGFESLTTITTGDYATAYGAQSLHSATASGNSAFGYQSGYRVTSATSLALFGLGSGDVLTSGGYNSFFGSSSGRLVTTGTYNLNLGYQITSGAAQSYNTFLGYNAAGTGSSCIAIGGSTAARSNSIQIGTQGAGNGQVNTCYVAGIYGTALTGTTAPVYIDSNGKLGTGIAATMPAFNYYQTADHNNVTGDGTEFYLVFADLTAQYDPLGTVTASGLGNAMFTAPSSGMYHLNLWITIGGLLPPPVPPPAAPVCPVFIRVTGTSAAVYALEGTVWNYQLSTGRQSVFNAVDTYMTAGDHAYFSISIVFPTAPGVKNLDVIGVLGGSRKTFISGFKIA